MRRSMTGSPTSIYSRASIYSRSNRIFMIGSLALDGVIFKNGDTLMSCFSVQSLSRGFYMYM